LQSQRRVQRFDFVVEGHTALLTIDAWKYAPLPVIVLPVF
jgi:hypothetical protein